MTERKRRRKRKIRRRKEQTEIQTKKKKMKDPFKILSSAELWRCLVTKIISSNLMIPECVK